MHGLMNFNYVQRLPPASAGPVGEGEEWVAKPLPEPPTSQISSAVWQKTLHSLAWFILYAPCNFCSDLRINLRINVIIYSI